MRSINLCLTKKRLSATIRSAGMWIGVLALVLVTACSSAPVQEMSEARQAIEAARVAGAEQHAAERYRKARSLLETAEDMLNQHHYSKARKSAALARDEAIGAREAAQQVVSP